MSNMLKYAAMSLLSKTLQTFLYKYLLDVDVEGVAMPSFMDVDGHSGWGVRLCNVRLREGVELMTLPGKRKVKIKRSKQKESESPKESVPEQTREASTTRTQGAAETSAARTLEPVAQTREEFITDVDNVERQSIPVSPDYYASDDGESDDVSDAPRSRTSSVTEARSWVCFSRGHKHAPKEAAPLLKKNIKDTMEEDATQGTQSSLSLAADGEADSDGNNVSSEKVSPHTEPTFLDTGNNGEGEEEEEYIEVENDMVLRLGNGGRIGVLDVRLVGKELHVSVEDAFLVVEACQRPEEPVDDTDAASAAGSEKDDGVKAKEPTAEKKKPAVSKKADKDMSEGERVLDKSAIARALSAIPHLFLRDCRVRLVVRDGDVGHEAEADISEKDSVIDLGIELLSVTSGEDFLAHVRADEDSTSNAFNEETYRSQTSFASYDESSNNEFIVKRIRTGRGPEGGIWLNIFPPGKRDAEAMHAEASGDKEDKVLWARQRWMENTEFCFFRCSGVDIRSRIFVGKQEETIDEYFFYDEFAVDSMLVGVDYIVPGPTPSLPPLSQGADAVALEAMQSMDGATMYETDKNGIQSVKMDSVFHKVARGLVPTTCRGDHLPCETCTACWAAPNATPPGIANHSLDASTPLAGVVLSLSLNDPLEINVDRSSLEVIGQLVCLFMKDNTDSETEVAEKEVEEDLSADVAGSTHGGRLCMPSVRRNSAKKTDASDSFPTYMQPENIEIIGVHVVAIVVRIHAMRSDGSFDGGLSFCYWETSTRCITMDIQKLCAEKNLQDFRIDVGEFTAVEYRGIKHSQLVSLGLHQPVAPDQHTTPTKSIPSYSPASPWPSTAYSLLGIPAPLETIHYESRERHALQLRYVAVSGQNIEEDRSTLDLRIGVASVDMPWQAKDDIYSVMSECKKAVFGAPSVDSHESRADSSANQSSGTNTVPSSSLMKCKIRIDGGRVNIHPVINLSLPPSTFLAEKSSSYGLFLETMLQRLEFAYGERAIVPKARRTGLSLFASLPEEIRLRVLLFVNDLGPLEAALGLKREKNALLRYRSVNKGIVKVAKHSSKSKRKKGKSRMSSSQREEVLAELLSMDDVALQELWALHRSNTQKPKAGVKR